MTEFKWVIEHFCSNPLLPGEYLTSPIFTVEPSKTFEFCFELYPRGCDSSLCDKPANCLLLRCDKNPRNITLKGCISLKHDFEIRFFPFQFEFKKCNKQEPRFWESNEVKFMLIPDNIYDEDICIQCKILGHESDNCHSCDKADLEALSYAFSNLLKNDSFTTECVNVGAEKFFVHKAILAARCVGETFEEKLENWKKLWLFIRSNAGKSTSRMLFEFLYSGKLDYSNITDELCLSLQKVDCSLLKRFDTNYSIKTLAKTSFRVKTIHLKWSIKNFRDVVSKERICRITEGSTWSWIRCVLKATSKREEDGLTLEIHRLDCSTNIFLRCSISLKQKELLESITEVKHILLQSKYCMKIPFNLKTDHTSRAEGKLSFGFAELHFNIAICKDEHLTQTSHTTVSQPDATDSINLKNLHDLADDFKHLLETEYLADTTLNVCGKTFPVHKAILSARSPIFNSMFKTDRKRKQNKVNIINNIKPEVFSALLSYIYCAHVDEFDFEITCDLYAAANRFEIPSLKLKCSTFLASRFSVENAGSILRLADKYGDDDLKSSFCKFMLSNVKQMQKCKQWMDVFNGRPNLCREVLNTVLNILSENV